jgi:hypothetical protein
MDAGSSSFQAQAAFQTNGGGAPIKLRYSRCIVTKGGTGIFFVQPSEDIADGSVDYGLGCGLDGGGAVVHCNVQKLAAFVWQITTSKIAGGVTDALAPLSYKFSGILDSNSGAAAAGFVPDAVAKVATINAAINYPLPSASASVKLSVFVDVNTTAATGAGGVTTFEVYKNGVATGDTIAFPAAAVGLRTATFATAFVAGDTIDLHVSTPGDDAAYIVVFGATMEFTNGTTAPALTPVDTTGATITLTLKRVDPM